MTSRPSFDPGFSTPEMTSLFSPGSRVRALMEFEAALAGALADAGVADPGGAEAVAAACRTPVDDPDAILASTWDTGTPIIALVDEIRGRMSNDEDRRWVHHGATSQDAVDTAQMLSAREGLRLLEGTLTRVAWLLLDLVTTHRSQTQMGRTFLQHARPTTFGVRAAMWLEPTLRHIQDLRELRSGLTVQLGGPVGNLGELGPVGEEVRRALAARLEMESPAIAWHTDRSRMWGLVAGVEQATRTMAKVATDVVLLSAGDVGEIGVRGGRSSSMSEKRNPIDAIRALASAEVCSGAAQMITAGRPHELDRAVGGWHVEWFALPLVFQSASAACASIERSLETLEVHGDVMASRVTDDMGSVADELDHRQIDRVVSLFDEVVGEG